MKRPDRNGDFGRMLPIFCGTLGAALLFGVGFGCSHGHSGRGAEDETRAKTGESASGSFRKIVLQKTGGIAGFRLELTVQPDGSWLARDLARGKDLSGTFAPTTLDSLHRAIEGLPANAWGSFPTNVVDDFQYQVSIETPASTRILQAGGTALPAPWHPVLTILERPWPELFRSEQ